MDINFDLNTYRNLLFETAPKVIESEAEYEQALTITEQLHFKKNRIPEETALALHNRDMNGGNQNAMP